MAHEDCVAQKPAHPARDRTSRRVPTKQNVAIDRQRGDGEAPTSWRRGGPLRRRCLSRHPKCEIDAGRHSRRGPNRAIGNEDPVRLHFDFRKAVLQVTGIKPMSCRTTTVEKACFGERERRNTDRRNSPRRSDRVPQKRDKARCRRRHLKAAPHHYRIELRTAKRFCRNFRSKRVRRAPQSLILLEPHSAARQA